MPLHYCPGRQSLELEKTSVNVWGWLEGGLDTPFSPNGGKRPRAHEGGHCGLENQGRESRVCTHEVLGTIVPKEGVPEVGEGAVVIKADWVGRLVNERAGQSLYRVTWMQTKTGMESGEFCGVEGVARAREGLSRCWFVGVDGLPILLLRPCWGGRERADM
jgi:hypothetical protein